MEALPRDDRALGDQRRRCGRRRLRFPTCASPNRRAIHFFLDLMRHLGRSIIPRTRIDSAGLAKRDRTEYVREVNREHGDVLRSIANGDSDAAPGCDADPPRQQPRTTARVARRRRRRMTINLVFHSP
jgi:hypothetical protein